MTEHGIALRAGDTSTFTVRNDEPLDAIARAWSELQASLAEPLPFVTPDWQRIWLQHFQGERYVRVFTARDEGGKLLGVIPLMLTGDRAEFVGHYSICDYMDAAIVPGAEGRFWHAVLSSLCAEDAPREIELRGMLESSPTLTAITECADACGWRMQREEEAISPWVTLPASWEEYLATLSKKDRHEMRRKMRRLDTAGGDVRFSIITSAAEAGALLDRLFHLMRISNHHKEEFLARPGMEAFFREMTGVMADAGMLRLYSLSFDGEPVAMVLNFDIGGRLYMYNSGYDPAYSHYAVGLMSKALLLRDAIENGRAAVDFMRGDESYKYDLGGKDRKVYRLVLKR
jgi:CelD/BcsL family acetyltransferase involved in cellulose biosynthesis